MKLIVGLGNPGEKYKSTRHNIGFVLLETYAGENSAEWREDKKFDGLVAQVGEFILLKPLTFMNKSGESVSKCLNFYKVSSSDLIVVHDDVDLEFGKVKKQFAPGTAGHHGVEDIVKKLSTKDFWRIRIGSGRPNDKKFDVYDWVLSKFTPEESELIKNIRLSSLL